MEGTSLKRVLFCIVMMAVFFTIPIWTSFLPTSKGPHKKECERCGEVAELKYNDYCEMNICEFCNSIIEDHVKSDQQYYYNEGWNDAANYVFEYYDIDIGVR
ncbi:MAG: hypothetical protein J6S60_04535 [Oscillospiraceae bacterium]|nr:hypothetical protein [Oscillospiraceae bacterium]